MAKYCKYTDASGLQYLHARYYHPALATFLTRDPFEGVMQRALSRNGYSYVEGNPITRVDPSGKFWPAVEAALACLASVGCIAAVAAVAVVAYLAYKATTAAYGLTCTAYPHNPGCGGPIDPVGDLCRVIGQSIEHTLDEIRQRLERLGTDTSTQTRTQTRTDTQTKADEKTNQQFDLAFGIYSYLAAFAASFIDRPTYWWSDWPKFMRLDDNGNELRLADEKIFKAHFHGVMATYFASVPDGKLKFNLYGMDNQNPETLTTWELATISTLYFAKAQFYLYDGITKRRLRGTELEIKLDEILVGG